MADLQQVPAGGSRDRARAGIVLATVGSDERGNGIDLVERAVGPALARSRLGDRDLTPFRGRAVMRLEPDIGIASIFAPARQWRDARPGKRLMLVRPATGRLQVSRGGDGVVACSRDALLVADTTEAVFEAIGVERVDILVMERTRLPSDLAGLDPSLLRRIGRGNPGLQALALYGAGLLRGLIPVTEAALGAIAQEHLFRLLAFIAVHETPEPECPAPDRRHLCIQAIKAEIEIRLGTVDLTLASMARAQRVSERHLQILFQAEGDTFSGFVLRRRLDRARQMLASETDLRPVSRIAFDVGFGDLSYFNRTFRKRFGTTPTQVRRGIAGLSTCSPNV